MVSLAKITKKEIEFIDFYDGRLPLLAEVYHDEYRYNNRLKSLEYSKDRKIVKQYQHGNNIYIIIHKRVFILPPVLSGNVSDYLSAKKISELEKVTKKFSKEVSKIIHDMNGDSKTVAIKRILFALENQIIGR